MTSTFDIDSDLVRKLSTLLKETGLAEIEFADGDKKVRVRSASSFAPTTPVTITAAAPEAKAAPAVAASAPDKAKPPAGTVSSPMVGTAYLASSPGAAPLIKIGDSITAGQTLLIIEAMKVMNPIKAPKAGTVTQIFVSNAQPVEFGEPLVSIE